MTLIIPDFHQKALAPLLRQKNTPIKEVFFCEIGRLSSAELAEYEVDDSVGKEGYNNADH